MAVVLHKRVYERAVVSNTVNTVQVQVQVQVQYSTVQ